MKNKQEILYELLINLDRELDEKEINELHEDVKVAFGFDLKEYEKLEMEHNLKAEQSKYPRDIKDKQGNKMQSP